MDAKQAKHRVKDGDHEWKKWDINWEITRPFAVVFWEDLDISDPDNPTVHISNGELTRIMKFPVEFIGDRMP